MRIKQLPPLIANQIAAGEVIERPASVVKELLENSLDAKAQLINIEIGHGGLNQIKVSDNGHGIVAEDLPLAIAAHATSKISELNDLYSIASMGFRGEALASIAAISRMLINSKPREQEHAMELSFTLDQGIQLTPIARSQGTTVEVRDLFYNAPVRKKFLKSERYEFQAIELVVKRFALSAPQLAIHLQHNGKTQFSLMAANCDKTRWQRMRKLFGKAFIEQAIHVDIEHTGLQLRGWISSKDYQRSQTDQQWIYVNQRIVKDKLLNHAFKQAYEELLYPGRHPACLLYLSIPAQEVDVNVHPTKHEVRFQNPRLVHDFIRSQIQRALQESHPTTIDLQQTPKKQRDLPIGEMVSAPAILSREPLAPQGSVLWFDLNSQFAVIFLQGKPYLGDVIKLQQLRLLELLQKEPLPLASRPLLVPVSYALNSFSLEKFPVYHDILRQLGIQIGLAGEKALLIRSLPLLVPHLEIKQFLATVFASSAKVRELVPILVATQTPAPSLSPEEKKLLIDYLELQGENSKTINNSLKQLSPLVCRNLLNTKCS